MKTPISMAIFSPPKGCGGLSDEGAGARVSGIVDRCDVREDPEGRESNKHGGVNRDRYKSLWDNGNPCGRASVWGD